MAYLMLYHINRCMRECPNCGETITKRYNKYCSNKCQAELRAKERLERYLIEDTFKCPNKQLAPWLKAFIRERDGKCVECGISAWNGNPITLDVDHIDGDYRNNSQTNLRCLCPNCHSQTETYKNRNYGSGRTLN